MTHSHDRTLLASLSFSDPDKREPLHDLACEYLSEPEQARRLVQLACSIHADIPFSVDTKLEAAISKGNGQYKTTIGFLDLKIEWKSENRKGSVIVEVKIHRVTVGDILRQINLYREYVWSPRYVDAETFKARLREAQRFSGFNEGLHEGATWVLASTFDIDAGQTELLTREGILPVHLSEGFTKWFENRQLRPILKPEEF